MTLVELTKYLCSLAGPSGFEEPVCKWLTEYARPFADEIKTDVMGNFLAVKRCGKPGAKSLLLDAHMDEVGLIVTAVEEGFLRFECIGGIDHRMLPAREVRVLTDPPLYGIVNTMPPHVLPPDEMGNTIPADKLRIDIGMSQESAEKAVLPGTPVVYAGGCEELGGSQLCGKAMDDRSCAAIILKAFEDLSGKELPVDVYCLISSQEEVGGRGAMVAAWNTEPDYAIVVDVTHAKTPDGKDVITDSGKGVAIGIGPNMNRAMTMELFRLAKEREIPFQTEVCPSHSGTNAEEIQVSRQGVATAVLSLPLKYMHTPLETARVEDMEAIRQLIVAYAETMEV